MNIIEKKISELHPYGNNPRRNDDAVEYVANSIKEFGFKVPLVVDKDGIIVTGHTRWKAAKKLGMQSVPCIIADDLTDEQIKAFRLADNKVAEMAEWDYELLDIELDDIELDMTDFGFDEEEEKKEPIEVAEDEADPFEDIEKLDNYYGVPYQGNKSRIADRIISVLPSGKRLVDLFGGGGAITHCALLSGKWESQLYNDINPLATTLFIDAVNGKYADESRTITRDDFERLKDSDGYVKYIWSFGNNGDNYLWGADIEDVKCQACRVILAPNISERRLNYMKFLRTLNENKKCLQRLESVEHLQSLQALQVLQRLEALQRLEVSNIDYRDYQHKDGDVVYCDVPYEQTGKASCNDYGLLFDSLEFYKWVKEKDYPVFFSSYEISDDSFYKVKIDTVRSLMGDNRRTSNEYVYSNFPIEVAL